MINRRGVERLSWLVSVLTAVGEPDVGRVIGADCRRHMTCIEQTLTNCQRLVAADTHQHDVDQILFDVLTNQVAVFFKRAKLFVIPMMLCALAGRSHSACHVGVLGVCQNELTT